MRLALDTSQRSGSIALADAQKLLYSAYFDLRITHSETLMPQIDHALKICGLSPEDLSEIYVCIGPGSFTGLRIGLATAKGIAFALKIPVITGDSLQLTALPCLISGRKILSVIDARMKEVYAALYDHQLNEIVPPQVITPSELAKWDLSDSIVIGSGTELLKPILEQSGLALDFAPGYYQVPKAEGLFDLALISPPDIYYKDELAELEPLYLRESTAQIKRRKSKA